MQHSFKVWSADQEHPHGGLVRIKGTIFKFFGMYWAASSEGAPDGYRALYHVNSGLRVCVLDLASFQNLEVAALCGIIEVFGGMATCKAEMQQAVRNWCAKSYHTKLHRSWSGNKYIAPVMQGLAPVCAFNFAAF